MREDKPPGSSISLYQMLMTTENWYRHGLTRKKRKEKERNHAGTIPSKIVSFVVENMAKDGLSL